MSLCNHDIRNGMILRYILTIVSFFILLGNYKHKIIHTYLYLILPILLTILDGTDNIFILSHKKEEKNNECSTKTFYYQHLDKICDCVSYLLLFFFFKLDNLLLYFVLYRIVGVLLFYLTKNSIWLILFFDFIKEFFLYTFVFGDNYTYLTLFVPCKIAFEYYWHNVVNKSHY